jgi:DNA gyrase subunit B
VASTPTTSTYDASKLELIEGLRHVRLRPHMYINSTGNQGLHHLIEEIVANSVDEAMAGHCDNIIIDVAEDGWVTVIDNGRGIPVDLHAESGLSGLELVLTRLGGGGKFGGEESGYKTSGGLHGVGAAVVNALSTEMKAVVSREGFEWEQTYMEGVPAAPVAKGAKTEVTGTSISWCYDASIFDKGVKYDRVIVEERLRELAALNPGLTFVLRFHGSKEQIIKSAGLSDYLKELVAERDGVEAVHRQPIVLKGEVEEMIELNGKEQKDATYIDVALLWSTDDIEHAHSFANSVRTPKGGDHYDGLRSGLRKCLNDVAEELGKFRAKDVKFEQNDTREGLYLAVSVRVSDPRFESQAKLSLQNPEVSKRVDAFINTELRKFLLAKENHATAEAVIERVIEARDARLAASKARSAVTQRKGLLGSSGLPGKLADCDSKEREETEIYLVEGDSAGGNMKQERNRATQAVLPLKGKIQNAEKAGEATLSSDAIKDILSALGGTITPVTVQAKRGGKTVNRTRLVVDFTDVRYGKVVMCADADVDGGHIVTLLMTFFFRYAPSLIRDGRLWLAVLPLFKAEHKKRGRIYLFSEEELQSYIQKDEIKNRPDGTADVGRFKGLGEMDAEELEECALNPETRRLRRVVIDDLGEAENMTVLLMGSRVDRRREYIEENALSVEADV